MQWLEWVVWVGWLVGGLNFVRSYKKNDIIYRVPKILIPLASLNSCSISANFSFWEAMPCPQTQLSISDFAHLCSRFCQSLCFLWGGGSQTKSFLRKNIPLIAFVASKYATTKKLGKDLPKKVCSSKHPAQPFLHQNIKIAQNNPIHPRNSKRHGPGSHPKTLWSYQASDLNKLKKWFAPKDSVCLRCGFLRCFCCHAMWWWWWWWWWWWRLWLWEWDESSTPQPSCLYRYFEKENDMKKLQLPALLMTIV